MRGERGSVVGEKNCPQDILRSTGKRRDGIFEGIRRSGSLGEKDGRTYNYSKDHGEFSGVLVYAKETEKVEVRWFREGK